MTNYPPTPVVKRRAQRLASHPYMRFKTDFRVSNQADSEPSQSSNYPSFRRAISIETLPSNTPDVDASSLLSLAQDASSSRRTDSLPPFSARTLSASGKKLLQSIEESEHEHEQKGRTGLASPSTSVRWTSNYRMVPMDSIEEDELEDDGCPPISSSPGRSSDSFGADLFPPHESSSSPQTSDHSPDAPHKPEFEPPTDDFGARLHHLLTVVSRRRERSMEIDDDLADTLGDCTLPVTPDYPAASTPPNRRDAFGPRSFSSSLADFGGSHSTSRSASVASCSGYAADLDTSLAQTPSQKTERRSANSTPTQRLIITDPSSVDSPLLRAVKRSFSSLREDSGGSNKKSRSNSRVKISSDNTYLSRVPASLRKSLSLRSDASPFNRVHPAADDEELVPTVPNTPCPPKTLVRAITESASRTIPSSSAVPIIAPPPGHVARLPLSKEACAKIRIVNFLAREAFSRAADKLEENPFSAVVSEGARESERLRWELLLGVGPELRLEVVDWILKVLPKKYLYHPSISTSSKRTSSRTSSIQSFASFDSSDGSDDEPVIDLLDQLLTSPETRFHAAYMFARYFYVVMGDIEERRKIEAMQESLVAANNNMPWDPAIPPDGWKLVAWDCCLACLALSVKLHRDVLEPLNPVFSWEFEALAPHKVTYDDLEIAQRDVLSAFSFSLGGTPQQLLDEIWTSLPSLQQLLGFSGGWNHALKETWGLLFDAVREPDVLRFPISLLTVSALVEALLPVIVSKYEYAESLNTHAVRRRSAKKHADSKKLQQKLVAKVEREIEGVVQDIQAVVGVSDEKLKMSRSWLRAA